MRHGSEARGAPAKRMARVRSRRGGGEGAGAPTPDGGSGRLRRHSTLRDGGDGAILTAATHDDSGGDARVRAAVDVGLHLRLVVVEDLALRELGLGQHADREAEARRVLDQMLVEHVLRRRHHRGRTSIRSHRGSTSEAQRER